MNRLDVKRAVESLTYSRGSGKNEADVFQHVTNVMFTSAAGDRPNVPNVVSSAFVFVFVFQSEKYLGLRTKRDKLQLYH